MATKPLLSISELLEQSWQHVRENADSLTKRTSLFVLLALISFGLNLIAYAFPDTISPGVRLLDLLLIQLIGAGYVSMRLTQLILSQETGDKKIEAEGGKAFPRYVWVSILTFLATLGGAFVFVLPGIWLVVVLSFATLLSLEDRRTGTQALAASAELVKGRWWATLVRLIVPGFLLLCLYFLVTNVLNGLVTLIAGYSPSQIVADYAANYWWSMPPKQILFAFTANQAIGSIAMALFAPLFIAVTTRLFHDLKKTA